MIKKFLSVIKTFKDAAIVRNSPLAIVSQSIVDKFNDPESKHRKVIRKHLAKHRSRKLHKAILSGKAPRGRTV